MLRKYITVIIFGFIGVSVSAQKFDVKRYSVNEGLPSGQVYDIDFDEQGFAWLATAYGLVRVDGKNYKTIGEKNGLKEELLNDIFIDSNENFWIASVEAGVALLKGDSVVYLEELDFLNTKDVNYMTESSSGELWFGTTSHGIYIWNRELNQVDSLNSKNGSIIPGTIWDIYIDDEGLKWISTHSGLVVLGEENSTIFTLTQQNGLNGFSAYQTFEDSNGEKWIASSNGVTIVSPDFSTRNISNINGTKLNYVYNINQDDKGRVWIATERDGLFWYSKEKSTHITKKNGLSSNYLYRLVKDRNGDIWVATDGDGVTIFKDTRFIKLDSNSAYGQDEVFGTYKAKNGTMWFANSSGLTSYTDGEFKTYNFPDKYRNEEIWDIRELKNGNLVLLSYEHSLLTFDGKNFGEYEFQITPKPYYSTSLLVEDDETLVLSSEGGIVFIKGEKVDSVNVIGSDYWSRYVNIVYKDKEGIYWLGTEDGIVEYKDGRQTRYNKDDGVEGNSVYEIAEDQLGNLWFGTNKGITSFTKLNRDENPYSVRTFETDKNYLMETIFIQFDQRGGLWQGTNAGLNYYNLHDWNDSGITKSIHFPLREYGRGIEFNGSASLIDDDGNLWFGTADDGIVKFTFSEENEGIELESGPQVFLNNVTINGKEISKPVLDDGAIELYYNENNMEIYFRVLNYKDPNRILFRYKLEGFEDTWQEEFNVDNVRYNNLKWGGYSFKVFAKASNSMWTDVPATIQFQIKKPFWITWWFILLCVLFLISLVFFLARVRLHVIEKEKLNELVDAQTSDLQLALDEKEVLIKEIHHRVKNNLAVVSGLLEMQTWDMDEGYAKQAIEESKLRVLAMSKVHENLYQNKDLARIDFSKFLEDLVAGIVSTLRTNAKKINVYTESDQAFVNVNMGIPCGLIINELITNSYKHAFEGKESGEIRISFHATAKHYQIIVQDDGIGAPEDVLTSSSSSLGITLINSLVTQLNSKMIYEYRDGSYFEITIPKKEA